MSAPGSDEGIGGPVLSGQEWLDRFMHAQASLQAQQFFLMFAIGQLGAAAAYDQERAKEIIEVILDTDIPDVTEAAEHLAKVARDIVANISRNAGL